jgi:predicted RNA-binding Zn ribbon-like protein
MSDRAPGNLELVRLFVNTVDLEGGPDELSDPAALRRWLAENGLMAHGSATRADLHSARRLREAIRGLLLENNGMSVRKESAVTLSRAAAQARLAFRFEPAAGVRLEPASGGVPGALGRLVAIVAVSMTDGTWSRLKACQADRCGWAFYDHARNRSRRWCSMAVCGNRTKARSYRRRHATPHRHSP